MKADGCKEEPTTEELPDKANDGTKLSKDLRRGQGRGRGRSGRDRGRRAPLAGPGPGLKMLGRATRNVSANDLMGEFFEKHP